MVYSSFIIEKAQELVIDLSEPAGILLVCKRLLEKLWWQLGGDLRVVIADIDGLEGDLREVKNVFSSIQRTTMPVAFIDQGYITSIEIIVQGINRAYAFLCAASKAQERAMDDIAFQNLLFCQGEIGRALQGFCIS
jgi:hypothetical protein